MLWIHDFFRLCHRPARTPANAVVCLIQSYHILSISMRQILPWSTCLGPHFFCQSCMHDTSDIIKDQVHMHVCIIHTDWPTTHNDTIHIDQPSSYAYWYHTYCMSRPGLLGSWMLWAGCMATQGGSHLYVWDASWTDLASATQDLWAVPSSLYCFCYFRDGYGVRL